MRFIVKQAKKRDIGRNIVRIDPTTMEVLDMQTGDVIRIFGYKESAGIAYPSYPQDNGLGIVRIDSRLRTNTGTSIDDSIEILKIDPKNARDIVLAPTSVQIRTNPRFESFLKRKLINYPVSINDIINVSIGIKRELLFKVIRLDPNDICVITKKTTLHVSENMHNENIYKFDSYEAVSYEDIGGLDDEIQKIRENLELSIQQPSVVKHLGIETSRGILLTGPSGCGKTLLANAIANETDLNFIAINGPEIMERLYGESEKKLRQIFNEAEKKGPSIIFIDKIDTIALKIKDIKGEMERRVVSELAILMDGLYKLRNVIVIGETSRLEDIEESLLRPGRFDEIIEIKPPNVNQRYEILLIHTRKLPHKDLDLKMIAEKTDGYVGADIYGLCRKAAMHALKRKISKIDNIDPELLEQIEVEQEDFDEALKEIIPLSKKVEKESNDQK